MRYVLAILFFLLQAIANPTKDAIDAGMKATYEQSGMKHDVEEYGKCLEKHYIRKEQEKYWSALVFVADSLAHNEIKVKWTF